jgi:glycosyltransferase involved in cell wall biosynthesis
MPDHRVQSEGTLSVCMIVKNEADLLGRCLRSIQSVADQIVVVDTGSQDRTIEVAKSFSAAIVEVQWRGDFSWARNISLDHAASAWVLWLDADDVVPAQSLPLIADLKKERPDRVLGLVVRNQRPNDTGTEFVQARMFPNRPEIRFERRVHEQMMPSALRCGLRMEKCDVVIEHHGYAEQETLKRKARRNIDLMLEEYDQERPDPVTAVEIADSFQLIDELGEAEKWYRTVLAVPNVATASPAIASQAHTGLGNLYNRQERFDPAIGHLKEAVALTPWRTDAFYAMAVAFDCAGKPESAVECLRRIREIKPDPGQVGVDFRAAAIKATLRLLRILAEQRRSGEAKAEAALIVFPERPEIALMAGKVFLMFGDLMTALKLFEKSIELATDHPHIDSYIGLCIIYLKANRVEVAQRTIESIRPLFENIARYWAFWKYGIGGLCSIAGKYSDQEIEQEWGLIRRDFFNVLK